MTRKGKKLEPKLHLDLNFGEALERFAQTDPKEVAESIERAKQKRPPEDGSPRRPAHSSERGTSPSGRPKRKSPGD